jgi:hypothetical protein
MEKNGLIQRIPARFVNISSAPEEAFFFDDYSMVSKTPPKSQAIGIEKAPEGAFPINWIVTPRVRNGSASEKDGEV